MIVVPYKKEHMAALKLQSAQLCNLDWMPEGQAALLEGKTSFTALDGSEVLACAGHLEFWEGRVALWAFMAENIGNRFLAVHRSVKRYIDMLDCRRIEIEVAITFTQGHRWASMLGFQVENPRMHRYFPDGTDAVLYTRIK